MLRGRAGRGVLGATVGEGFSSTVTPLMKLTVRPGMAGGAVAGDQDSG